MPGLFDTPQSGSPPPRRQLFGLSGEERTPVRTPPPRSRRAKPNRGIGPPTTVEVIENGNIIGYKKQLEENERNILNILNLLAQDYKNYFVLPSYPLSAERTQFAIFPNKGNTISDILKGLEIIHPLIILKALVNVAKGIEILNTVTVPHIVHNDIYGMNIVIGTDGVGRILDFGEAATYINSTDNIKINTTIEDKDYCPPEYLCKNTDTNTVKERLGKLYSGSGEFSKLYQQIHSRKLNTLDCSGIEIPTIYPNKIDIYSLGILFINCCVYINKLAPTSKNWSESFDFKRSSLYTIIRHMTKANPVDRLTPEKAHELLDALINNSIPNDKLSPVSASPVSVDIDGGAKSRKKKPAMSKGKSLPRR